MRYYSALSPRSLVDYYTGSWERAKLVLLGSQDPNSAFFAFRDADFVWQYFFRHMKRAMKSDVRYPGFFPLDEAIIKKVEGAYSDFEKVPDFLRSEGVRRVHNYCTYFIEAPKSGLSGIL